jgi:dCMP deaminase
VDGLVTWDYKFICVAKLIASWSKHPTTKVGCYIVDDDHNELSSGYNGLPRKVNDKQINNQESQYSITCHAEANAVAKAARKGHALYGGTAYVTAPVCCQCAALLIQAGIKIIHMPAWEFAGPKWSDNCKRAVSLLMEAGVVVIYSPQQ